MAIALIAQALANACKKHKSVCVVAVCFVSNHYHIILAVMCDEDAWKISEFLKTLNQTIAQDLNVHRERGGHFFGGKPKILPILDDAALADRMTYTHAQPIHHGLVERAEDWIGLSSFRAVCDGKSSLDVPYFDERAWREAGSRPEDVAEHTTTVSIPLTAPFAWSASSDSERRAAQSAHEQSVRDREREKNAERNHGDRRALPKASSYAKTDPFSRPTGPRNDAPQPWAHGSDEAVASYRSAYSLMLAAYRAASAKFRATGTLGIFPAGTFPPWASPTPLTA
ncbi:MAG: hypothetical protein K1X94_07285 [Sandaracinaceae bacterium]|nr:hypothetical protein [Sandaracinaceae bacterium]